MNLTPEEKIKNDLRYAKLIAFVLGFAIGMATPAITASIINHLK